METAGPTPLLRASPVANVIPPAVPCGELPVDKRRRPLEPVESALVEAEVRDTSPVLAKAASPERMKTPPLVPLPAAAPE
jgi:hypothetical protein